MDRALPIFTAIGGTWRATEKRFLFPSGAYVEFGYCETMADVLQYQGDAFQYIGYDELGQLPEEKVWTYLISRNRPTAAGQTLQMRGSANPGGPGHHWLKRRFIDPCPPDGTLVTVETGGTKTTRAFVAAKLADNPTLMANDPAYGARLRLLPDLEYRWLAEGDWTAGAGLAFRLDARHKLPEDWSPPSHWNLFGGLDWGYNHPFSWGLYAADEDGGVVLLNTATGRHLEPPDIVSRVASMFGERRVRYTVAGHDCWADIKARGERGPTLAEQFAAAGFPLIKANISRVAGVQNLRRYLAGERPRFRWVDTPTNRAVVECLETRVSDPDYIEDVLKTDADDAGQGGDDHYDQVRYALMSRPLAALAPKPGTVKIEDRARPLDPRTLQPVNAPAPSLDSLLTQGQPARPSHRVPPRKWR